MNKITEIQNKFSKFLELQKEIKNTTFSSESTNFTFLISAINDNDFNLHIKTKRKDLVNEVLLNSADVKELKKFLSDVLDEQKEKEDLVTKYTKQQKTKQQKTK